MRNDQQCIRLNDNQSRLQKNHHLIMISLTINNADGFNLNMGALVEHARYRTVVELINVYFLCRVADRPHCRIRPKYVTELNHPKRDVIWASERLGPASRGNQPRINVYWNYYYRHDMRPVTTATAAGWKRQTTAFFVVFFRVSTRLHHRNRSITIINHSA